MALYDALYRGHADAVPFEMVRNGEPLERYKDLFRIRHVEADPVVPDETDRFSLSFPHTKFDDRFFPHPRVFPCVADEILNDYTQKVRIASDNYPFSNPEGNPALGRFNLKAHGRHSHQLAQIDRLPGYFTMGHAGEIQYGANELIHPLASIFYIEKAALTVILYAFMAVFGNRDGAAGGLIGLGMLLEKN
jgi:hypothetical protein